MIRHAQEHPYVHHALLTFSALHMASLTANAEQYQNPPPHLVIALSQKALAIERFRPVVESVTAETCEPALAASGLLTACAFALPLAGAPFDVVDQLAQITSLFQGTTTLFRMGWRKPRPLVSDAAPKVRPSVLLSAVNEKSWPQAEHAVDQVLRVIMTIDERHQSTRGRKDVLVDAALKLKIAFRRVAAARGAYAVAAMWLGMVSSAFVDRVRERDSLALVLMADWSVSLKDVQHVWWSRGWAERTVNAVSRELGEHELYLLNWALVAVNENCNQPHELQPVKYENYTIHNPPTKKGKTT
ncbi:uncharacterized protein JN550_006367 [Neoarthrinium moseri]|uniref:uncharacterized protein n=1 Tax=Neoarthrinium moseri TaxID=1658444 RepID=UPI001FDB0A41|nr:uncharacterized protein JN550_006367 [Neoarthrinium moseri]KAI1868451.1 hypothetical protein JN550_006367 [Neoarthrinium moseri]